MPLCPLFDVNGLCDSSCTTCGTLCAAFPITDLQSLALYKTKGCTIVSGDLYIQNLPIEITRGVLSANLGSIQFIKGDLHFKENAFIVSMVFFKSLISVYGVYYYNNPELVDARMPLLQTLSGSVSVEGSPRLCPARYTAIESNVIDDSGCTSINLKYYLHIDGVFSPNNLAILSSVLGSTTGELIGNKVSIGPMIKCILMSPKLTHDT